jgi:signal transduction histidine kinase
MKRLLLFYCLFIFAIDLNGANKKESSLIEIGKEFTDARIGQSLFYFKDETENLTFSQILQNSDHFFNQKFSQNEILLGFSPNDYWFTFTAKNTSADTLLFYLTLANPNTDELDVYFLSSIDTLSFSPVGDNFLYPKTSYAARNYAFPLSFPPNENCKVFIKLSAQLEPIEIPIFLSSESFYFKRAKNDFFYLGVFTGLFFLFILFLICLYFFSKNNVFLYYANLNLIIFLFYISQTGFGFQYIWPNYPIVQKLMPSLTVFGFLLLTTFFIKNLFNLAIRFSNFNKLFNLINVLLVLSFIFNYIYSFSPFERPLPFQISFYILNFILILYGGIFTVMILYSWLKLKRQDVIWAFIGPFLHIIKNASLVIFNSKIIKYLIQDKSLYDFNIIKTHVFLPNIFFFIDFTQIILISIILANYFRKINNEYILGSRRLNDLQRKSISAIVSGQEKQRQKLILKIDAEIKREVTKLITNVRIAKQVLQNKSERELLEEIESDFKILEQNLDNLSFDKLPVALESGNFLLAIKDVFQTLERNEGVKVNFEFSSKEDFNLTDFEKINVYRIVQEIVSNILKHAYANEINVIINNRNRMFNLTVKDNGVGFDKINSFKNDGIGLPNMFSRVKSMNGELVVEAKSGEGTTLNIFFPYQNKM